MNVKELAEYLSQRAEDVCQWLLPNGKKYGREWKVGSVNGEEGQSLAVCLAGDKRGIWADFSNQDKSGDLIDLICEVRGVNLAGAMEEAAKRFGLVLEPKFRSGTKTFVKPKSPEGLKKPTSPVTAFLLNRGITEDTAQRFRLGTLQNGSKTFLVMPYLRDGERINIKYRNIEDKKEQRQEKDCEPCLYGWHLIDPNCRAVVICEGEFDAMILQQCGVAALSVNQGAGNHQWIENDWTRLQRFSDIIVWFDNDAPGQKGALEVGKRLGETRVKYVVSKEKDANDTFLHGGADEIYEELCGAKARDPDELKTPKDFENDLLEEFFPTKEGSYGCPLNINETFDFLSFRPGEVTTWTGENGHGKSAFLGYQTIAFMNFGRKVAIFSGEMPANKLLRRYARQLIGKHELTRDDIKDVITWLTDRLYIYDHVGNAPIDRLIEVFSYAAKRYGVNHFVIDSLMMTDVPEDGNGFMEKQRVAVTKMMNFAKETGSHVHLVAHPRKVQDGKPPTKNDIAGSGKIAALSHNICCVFANYDRKEGERDGYFFLYKQRNGDVQHKKIGFDFDAKSMQYMTTPGDAMRWI